MHSFYPRCGVASFFLGVDSLSILFNHGSFQSRSLFPWVFDGFLKIMSDFWVKNGQFPPVFDGFLKINSDFCVKNGNGRYP